MSAPWSRFTDEQRRAAFLVDRSVISTAAAGSGKTQVMAVRYCACLLRDATLLAPERILAITFTREAAANLRSRIDTVLRAVLGQPVPSFPDYRGHDGAEAELTPAEITHLTLALAQLPAAPIGTVDSFCLGLVSDHADLLGRDPGLTPPSSDGPEGRQCQEAAWLRLRTEANAVHGGDLAPLVAAYGEHAVRELITTLASQAAALPLDAVVAAGGAVLPALIAARRGQIAGLATVLLEAQELCRASAAKGKLVETLRAIPAPPPLAVTASAAQAVAYQAWLGNFEELKATGSKNVELNDCVRLLQDALDYPARRSGSGSRPPRDARLRCASLGAFAAWTAGAEELLALRAQTLARVLTRYQELLDEITRSRALADFAGTARQALRLLAVPEVARDQAARFRHILLDEAQDLNRLQGRLIDHLWAVPDSPRIFAVGDHRQSIYGFRHAEPALFQGWEDGVEARGGAVAPLGLNFRSHPELVTTVRGLFSIPPLRAGFRPDLIGAGRLHADFSQGGVVACWQASPRDDDETAAAAEAQQIANLISASLARGRAPQEHAVLLRTRARMRLYADALERTGIPVDTDFPQGLYQAQECWDVEAVLRLCLDPHDRFALACAVAGPWGVDDAQDRRLLVTALSTPTTQDAALMILGATPLGVLLPQVHAVLAAEGPAAGVRFLARQPALTRRYGGLPLARRRLANLHRLAEEHAQAGLSADVASFLERLQERRRLGADGAEADGEALGCSGVRLATIHAAKGLEWPVVILPEMAGRFVDHDRRRAGLGRATEQGLALSCGAGRSEELIGMRRFLALEQLHAERLAEHSRAFYVACTRAVEELHLIRSGSHVASDEVRCPADWLDQARVRWVAVTPSLEAAARIAPGARDHQALPPLAESRTPARATPRVRSVSELLAAGDPVTPERTHTASDQAAGLRRALGIRVHEALRRHGLGMAPSLARQAVAPFVRLLKSELLEQLVRSLSHTGWIPGWGGMRAQLREQPFCAELVIGDGQRLVSGTLDLLLQDATGAWHLYDFKSGAGAGGAHDVRQLQAYAQLCAPHLGGKLASLQVLDVVSAQVLPVAADAGIWPFLGEQWRILDAAAVATAAGSTTSAP